MFVDLKYWGYFPGAAHRNNPNQLKIFRCAAPFG